MDKLLSYSISILRLLKGSIGIDSDPKVWENLVTYEKQVREYFEKIGIFLHLDREDGYAFLRQTSDEDDVKFDIKLPVLTRKLPLTKEETLFLILLREFIIEMEEKDLSGSIILRKEELFDRIHPFFPDSFDEVDTQKKFERLLRKSEDLGFIKYIDSETLRIEKILKAKITVSDLERLRIKFKPENV
ncbi:DUF4194 domain-containing protein [Leptospira noguchii]|uniref:PF13835 domain protein n=1 Tax=Leptospira noguchii serovar Autumnalis str. ZUN142 TaxID=1085540 RepID=M6UN98_9LEPT|nr:DUF4194 domain-containing protein [Leptospira noguchii]EMO38743.1 PF13835 domain protein [Leptospira noguchii serovar Autumnalis str. ZUN142]UOG42011.1 DUF4194 domain-containing protein [Leptospira noguchii]